MKTKEERKEIQDGGDDVDVRVYTFSWNTNVIRTMKTTGTSLLNFTNS